MLSRLIASSERGDVHGNCDANLRHAAARPAARQKICRRIDREETAPEIRLPKALSLGLRYETFFPHRRANRSSTSSLFQCTLLARHLQQRRIKLHERILHRSM